LKAQIARIFKYVKRIALFAVAIFIIGYLIPQNLIMPVVGATSSDYNHKSYWAYPWGKSITHKGVDIFADKGTDINASTNGIVISTGEGGHGGKYVLILGPKWRIHYYAHLNEIKTSKYALVNKSSLIGTVGTTGNAQGKPPHLHYAIVTPIPYPWRFDFGVQGWKKMTYLNPIEYLAK